MGGGLTWLSVWLVVSLPFFKNEEIVRGFCMVLYDLFVSIEQEEKGGRPKARTVGVILTLVWVSFKIY